MKDLNESGKSHEDIMRDALELYILKRPKGLDFGLGHCWHILREIPRWVELRSDSMNTPKAFKKKRSDDAMATPDDSAATETCST